MSWLTKTLSIFNWKSKESEKNKQELHKKQSVETVGELKALVEKELPPLAWQRINLRVGKYSLDKFGLVLMKVQDDTKLPEELRKKIFDTIKELFNKELTF